MLIIGILVSVVLFSLLFYCGATALAFDSPSLRRNLLWPPGEFRIQALALGTLLGLFIGMFAAGVMALIIKREDKKDDEALNSSQK